MGLVEGVAEGAVEEGARDEGANVGATDLVGVVVLTVGAAEGCLVGLWVGVVGQAETGARDVGDTDVVGLKESGGAAEGDWEVGEAEEGLADGEDETDEGLAVGL